MARFKIWLALGGVLAIVGSSIIAFNLQTPENRVAAPNVSQTPGSSTTDSSLPGTPISPEDDAPFTDGYKVVKDGQTSFVRQAVHQALSKPVSSLSATKFSNRPISREQREREEEAEEARESTYPKPNPALFQKPDQRVQKTYGASSGGSGSTASPLAAMPSITSFDGIGDNINGFSVQYSPPDTSMDVSASQIVQTVNVGIVFLDKSGGVLKGPLSINSMWAGFGGDCQNDNDGDATVIYDRLAKRWVISQFALSKTSGSYLQCVAVSTSDDAVGTYNLYSFAYANFPDYPKLSVWPDAYYTTFNGFGSNGSRWSGSFICAYDRAKMIAGLAATQLCTANDTTNGSILVASIQGSTPPAAGTAAYAIGGITSGSVMKMWRLAVNWTSRTLTKSSTYSISVPSYNLSCGGACIPQSGTSNALDSLGDRLMYQFVYRNIDGTESFLASHSAGVNGVTGVRWYEFRTSGSTLVNYQAGTYSPDSNYRWMPAISMDKVGNIAMVYSKSSSTVLPTISVAGRLATDSNLGEITQVESDVQVSGGYQNNNLNRWGDYAAMVVDPLDDCTFWASTEYLPANGSWNWRTRIAKFKFASCVPTPATRYSVTGPSYGAAGTASSDFEVTTDGTYVGSITVTPSVGGVAMSPITLDFDGSTSIETFKVTPSSAGTVTFALSNDGGLINPTPPTYESLGPASRYTLTGPPSGYSGQASDNFVVAPDGIFTGSITITVALNGVIQTASTKILTFSNSATPQTFTVTPSSSGTLTLTASDSAGLTDPDVVSYLVTPPPPVITTFTTSGAIGSTVTITGSNLSGTSRVKIGGVGAASFKVVSATSVTAIVAAGTPNGPVTVMLNNGTQTSTITNFTVTYAPTAASSLSPTSGPVGTSITVSGSNLNNVVAVRVDSIPVSFSATATRLYFSIPVVGAAGSGKVVELTTLTNQVVNNLTLTVTSGTALPAITKLSPTSGGAGLAVTITGSNLASATDVQFNGISTPFTLISNTQILAAVPLNSSATGQVRVLGTAGSWSTANKSFTYSTTRALPTISSTGISPSAVTVGTVVTVTGTNLAGVTGIVFNGVTVTNFKVLSATQITFVVPVGATTGTFTITTTGGTVTSSSVTVY